MNTCDYVSILESRDLESIDKLYRLVARTLESCEGFEEVFERAAELIEQSIPCAVDEYSVIRYAGYILKNKITADSIREPLLREESSAAREGEAGFGGIAGTSLDELHTALQLRTGVPVESVMSSETPVSKLFPGLLALADSGSAPDPFELLILAGKSEYTDSVIDHIIRTHRRNWKPGALENAMARTLERAQEFGRTAWSAAEGSDEERAPREQETLQRFVIDIAAEHGIPLLDAGETSLLLGRHLPDTQMALSLIRYIGELGLRDLLPKLYTMLERRETPLPLLFGCIDVVGQIGGKAAVPVLERLRREHTDEPQALKDFIELSIREIGERDAKKPPTRSEGLTMVQCIFYGDVALPGQAGGGGLTTFLNDLGNNLASGEAWDGIYTFVLLPVLENGLSKPLMQKSGTDHVVVRMPVSFPPHDEAARFMRHEYEIQRTVRRSLERCGIRPDIFHIRYSDNASRAVMTLSRMLGTSVVFTLTPDPHRNFCNREGSAGEGSDEDVLVNLNKVFVADVIVRGADSLLLIGHDRKNNQILPYFPQLWLDEAVRRKPLRILPEGVRTDFHFMQGDSADRYLEMLTTHDGKYRLDPEYLQRPILLNVGRLNPLKGQHHLVQAWSDASLNERFNLVLVGGNLKDPDPMEAELIGIIDRIMAGKPELRGRFCHIQAVPNPKVRLLEQSIVQSIGGEVPNVYVCSSFKEEFGIAILEAMASGFLVIAPQNGGVSSYLSQGRNGFLIDTRDSRVLRQGLESILHQESQDKSTRNDALRSIARRGQLFVQETFAIERIARHFSDFYESMISHGPAATEE
jgi:glycosyltransferase involved in cell wall biosynthesis